MSEREPLAARIIYVGPGSLG